MRIFFALTVLNSFDGLAQDSTGTIVESECPPMTGTTTHSGSIPSTSATNMFALTQSINKFNF